MTSAWLRLLDKPDESRGLLRRKARRVGISYGHDGHCGPSDVPRHKNRLCRLLPKLCFISVFLGKGGYQSGMGKPYKDGQTPENEIRQIR